MAKEVALNDLYGVVGDDGKVTDLVIDGQRFNLVSSKTNPLTGGIKSIQSGGKEIVLPGVGAAAMNIAAAFKWFGSAQNSATYNQTTGLSALSGSYGIKIEAESDFDAVKIVWVNRAGNAINNCTALVGVSETAATDTNNNISQPVIGGTAYGQLAAAGSINGWRSVTWGGASSVNIGSAASAAQYAISDWIPLSSIARTDGGTRPLLMVRGQHDGSVDGNFAFLNTAHCANNRTASAANRGRIVQTSSTTTGVSVPANTGGLSNNAFEIFPIFRYRKPSLSVMVAGDSTEQNDALVSATLTSWGWRGCCDASSTSRPVNYLNFGCSSKTSAEYWARTQEAITAGVVPDVLVIGPASVNDGYSNLDRTFETARSRALEIIEYVRTKGVRFVCFIPLLPYNSNNASQDGYRTAFNTLLGTLAASNPGVSVLSFPGLGDGATPERWVSAMNNSADGIHPNETAIDTIMAPALTTYLNTI